MKSSQNTLQKGRKRELKPIFTSNERSNSSSPHSKTQVFSNSEKTIDVSISQYDRKQSNKDFNNSIANNQIKQVEVDVEHFYEGQIEKQNTQQGFCSCGCSSSTLSQNSQSTNNSQSSQNQKHLSKNLSSKTNSFLQNSCKSQDKQNLNKRSFKKSKSEENQKGTTVQGQTTSQQNVDTIYISQNDSQQDYQNQQQMSNQGSQCVYQVELNQHSQEQMINQQNLRLNFQWNNCANLNQIPNKNNNQHNISLADKFDERSQLINQRLREKNYFISKYLSQGGEGIIYEGFLNKTDSTNQEVVVFKILFTNKEDFNNEINILKLFEKRINVVEFKDSIEIVDDKIYVIVLEKCLSSLGQFLIHEQSFSFEKLLQIVFDLLDGLIQFRIYNILHLDIKPGNILISKKGVCLYTDFGISSIKKLETPIVIKGYTKKYASFEQLHYDPNINFNADVHSLGRTFEDLINTYRIRNNGEKNLFVEQLEVIVNNHMITKNKEEQKDCLELHCMIYAMIISSENKLFLEQYSKKVKEIIHLKQFDQNKDVPYFLQLKKHYQFILLKAQKVIYDNKPHEDIADTLQMIGQNYCELGDPQNGLSNELKSLDMRRSIKDSSQTAIACLLNSIGCSFNRLGDYKTSLKHQEESLIMKRQLYKEDNFEIAKTLNNIACNYQNLGQFDLSLKFMLESFEMRKKLFQYNHPSILMMLKSIGIYYNKLGDSQKAETYLLEYYAMAKKIYAESEYHPQIAQALHLLGFHQKAIGNVKKALEYELQSIEMTKQIYKKDHSDLATSYSTACSYYNDLGEFEIGLEYGLDSILMQRTIFNSCFENNPDVALALSNFSKSYRGLKKYNISLELALKSLEIRKKIFGEIHTDIADSLNDIGCIYYDCNNINKAITILIESLVMQRECFQRSHPKIAQSLFDLGWCYQKQADTKIALQYFQESLNMREEILIKNHPDIEITLYHIGCCYQELKQDTQALICFQSCKEHSNNNYLIENAIESSLAIYCSQGELKKALKLRITLLQLRIKSYQKDNFKIAQQLNDISCLYSILGQLKVSLKYKFASLELYERIFKKNILNLSLDFGKNLISQLLEKKQYQYQYQQLGSNMKILNALECLGNRNLKLGKIQTAISQFKQALKINLFQFDNNLKNKVKLIKNLDNILHCFNLLFLTTQNY